MDELSNHLIDLKSVELWIFNQLQNKLSPQIIVDDLMKRWQKGLFDYSAKRTIARFACLNGFISPLVDAFVEDLRLGRPLPWDVVFQLVSMGTEQMGKDLVDALLAGATRDKDLKNLSAAAHFSKHRDPRWQKITKAEFNEFEKKIKESRRMLFEEAMIFKNEGMRKEMVEVLQKIFILFPHDQEALKLFNSIQEREVDESLDRIKKTFERRTRPRHLKFDSEDWLELSKTIKDVQQSWNSDLCFEMAVGLFQMGLSADALNMLETHKAQWGEKEKFLELEILVQTEKFAEALESAQGLILEFKNVPESLTGALYFAAKAYYGLEDFEQAIAILKALIAHRPNYRDALILLSQWEQEAI